MSDTIPVRSGEEIDEDKLFEFMRSHGFANAGDRSVEQFPAGSSNLTYLVTMGSDEYVLRRPPFGNTVKTAHDMRREFDVLSKLSAIYPQTPKPILFCDDVSVTGSEFYLMERRKGLIIRGRSPALFEGSSEMQRRICQGFIENLVKLHSLDYEAAGLDGLGRPDGYVRRQVKGWTARYFAAKTGDWPELESAIGWLNENMPTESHATLIHNDYKFDNVMLDPNDLTEIVAVLDWEMATVGDPLMDLGTTLGYWMARDSGDEMPNMPFNPRVLMESISRDELVGMYAKASGRDTSGILFYYVFGTFKIAAIAQQIYARYLKGLTKDRRFADFHQFVGALGRIASNALEKGTI